MNPTAANQPGRAQSPARTSGGSFDLPIIKVCGVGYPVDARMVVEAGATHVGFVFAEGSRRRVTRASAETMVEASQGVKRVGVFQAQNFGTIRAAAKLFHLDIVQLHGGYELEDAMEVADSTGLEVWWAAAFQADVVLKAPAGASMLLVDTAGARGFGGTGETFDWASLVRPAGPFLVAGGLTPDNVVQAIVQMQPWGVDVSGGVELQGGAGAPRKDAQKVREFVERARAAFSPTGAQEGV
jgi:phosphoribosylanthranilate isomerase